MGARGAAGTMTGAMARGIAADGLCRCRSKRLNPCGTELGKEAGPRLLPLSD